MSQIDFLEKLLQGNTTEWRELGDVGTFQRGKRFVKTDMVSEGVPCIHYGEMYTRYGIWTKEVYSFINETTAARLRVANPGDVIIVAAGETIEDIGNGTAWLGDEDVIIHDACFSFKSNLHPKYVSYYLRTKLFKEQIKKYVSSGKISAINSTGLSKAKIPIPCPDDPKRSLAIQAQIVRVLDSFAELETELEAELEAELETRKKQFNHYRDQLFMLDENEVDYLPMGHDAVGKFIRGGGLQKKDFTEKGVGCIHYGQIYTHYGTYANQTKSFVSEDFAKKARMAKPGDLVIATTSENDEDVCKAVAWLGEGEIAVSSDACFYTHSLNPKYVAYFFQTEQFQKQKRPYITGSKVRRVNADNLAKILIPVPSPEKQAHIASVLDKFDTLTNSISEGLPREIKLRQKQYQYYRDLLYNFHKPEAVTE